MLLTPLYVADAVVTPCVITTVLTHHECTGGLAWYAIYLCIYALLRMRGCFGCVYVAFMLQCCSVLLFVLEL